MARATSTNYSDAINPNPCAQGYGMNSQGEPVPLDDLMVDFQLNWQSLEALVLPEIDTALNEGGGVGRTNLKDYWLPAGSAGNNVSGSFAGITLTDNNTVGRAAGGGLISTDAWRFDGSADYFSHSDASAIFDVTVAWTISLWANFDAAGVNEVLFSVGPSGGTPTIELIKDSGDIPILNVRDSGAAVQTANTGDILTVPAWRFFVCRYIPWLNQFNVFVADENLTAVTSANITAGISAQASSLLYVGRSVGGTANYFNGDMDQLVIQNFYLPDAWCDLRYNNGSGLVL